MVLVARYGEIFLKGKNRLDFEKKLVVNIQKMFGAKVLRRRNRILVDEGADLRRVFGLVSYSLATEVDLDIGEIKEKAWALVENQTFDSFAVASKKMNVDFELSSRKINELVGEYILKKTKKIVNLSNPDLTVGIELIDGKAYLFTETRECFGGLPVGVEGKVCLLVEDEKSVLAGLLMMKRGCELSLFGFSEQDISLLQNFSPKKLELKIIKKIEEVKGRILVVGNDLSDSKGMMVLNPLVGLDDEEIQKRLGQFKHT